MMVMTADLAAVVVVVVVGDSDDGGEKKERSGCKHYTNHPAPQ